MMPYDIAVSYGQDKHKVTIYAIITSDGISATVTGGERPHVGGMALSVPRKNGGEDKLRCDTWTTPVPGHRDVDVALSVSQKLCLATGHTAAVVAGLHIDRAQKSDIEQLLYNSSSATAELCQKIKELKANDDA